MKLSEILGWPKPPDLNKMKFPEQAVVFEMVVNACDREIDREALLKAISDEHSGNYEEGKKIADHIISTMPQWLKRIDNGKI